MVVTAPRVTVIVPVKDDPHGLVRCLQRLDEQDYPRSAYEVVVVDNGSICDLAPVVASREGTRLLREPRRGSYRARNAGLVDSDSEVVAFTDADCLPSTDWITEGVRALQAGADIVAGAVDVFAANPERPHAAEAWEVIKGFQQEVYVARSGWGATANLFVWRTVFEAVGPFNADLLSGGDAEWGRRATAKGKVVRFAASCRVAHPARSNYAELFAKMRRVQQGAYAQALLGGALPGPWWREAVLHWQPPIGALARAAHDPRLPTTRARLAYVKGEFFVRYAGMLIRGVEARRASGRT